MSETVSVVQVDSGSELDKKLEAAKKHARSVLVAAAAANHERIQQSSRHAEERLREEGRVRVMGSDRVVEVRPPHRLLGTSLSPDKEDAQAARMRLIVRRAESVLAEQRLLAARTLEAQQRVLAMLEAANSAPAPTMPSPLKLGGRTAEALVACLLRECHRLPCRADRSQLKTKTLQVAAVLLQLTSDEWPSITHEQLGKHVGLQERQTQAHISALKDRGLIEVRVTNGHQNTYDLTRLVSVLCDLLSEAA